MKHIELDNSTGELVTGLFLTENPGVHSEELQIRLISDKAGNKKKVDFRIWIDSIFGNNGKYAGPTKKGFRLTLEQYQLFRNEIIPQIDAKLKSAMLADEPEAS